MSERIPMTEEGMAKIRDEIAALEARRPEIKKAIAEAREKGDLSENADYHAAREELAMLDARISQLAGMLANSVLVDPEKAPSDKVALGHTVEVKRLSDGKVFKRTLVGAGQADPVAGKILVTSPLGKALIGHSAGEIVTAELPGGLEKLEILSIRFE